MRERLQKFLAEAGIASRRAGEQIILSGRVAVNGQTVRELGVKVDPAHDRVTVDNQSVRAKRKIYLALNKPRGLVCSRKDELDRPTIYELLPGEWGHLHSVGRLDFNSEGLLFLTNDGEFSLRLTHPRYGVRKKYVATVEGRVDQETLKKFITGVFYEGERFKAEQARLVSAEIPPQRLARRDRRGPSSGHRYAQQRVGPQARLVLRAVQRDQRVIKRALV